MLIVNQRGTVADMAFPSKLTSYFPAGRPVIAAVAAQSDTAREVESAGGGVVVPADDPAALAAEILSLKHARWRSDELGEAGKRYAASNLPRRASSRGTRNSSMLPPRQPESARNEPLHAMGGSSDT